MMRRTLAVVPAILLFLAAELAVAAGHGLAKLDVDQDGRISRAEALAGQKQRFERMDADDDGAVGRAEFRAALSPPEADDKATPRQQRQRARRLRAWFKRIDRDDSGAIGLAEYQAAMTPYFDRLDRNGDGQLDKRELQRALGEDRAR